MGKKSGSSLSRLAAIRRDIRDAKRRRAWLIGGDIGVTVKSIFATGVSFIFSRKKAASVPPLVKIDISPLCTLRCPHCVHADTEGRDRPILAAQKFQKSDMMNVEQFSGIINQIRGKALTVSIFYYGDPLTNPHADEMCGIARAAGLNVHMTTHFSYALSDARIERIARSGLTHLTVAVDGATQESYATTRIGGRLDWVLHNIRRLAAYKVKHGLTYPRIEIQHIKHPHHAPDEEIRVREIVLADGVDDFTSFVGMRYDDHGDLYNIVDEDLSYFTVGDPKPRSILPKCHWVYSSMVIKSNGDVIACCMHRAGQQHSDLGGAAVIDNVFERPIDAIWNGSTYRRLRALVANPAKYSSEDGASDLFCYGCERLTEKTRRESNFPIIPIKLESK